MKRTQLKDALRNIWKQKVSWFAIVVIAMLSVMAYLGINFASRGIAGNGNAFYDETHFRDAEIISTLLITQDDMDAIRAVEGVADAEGVYQTSGKLANAGAEQNVDVVSLTERISVPQLLEGRLPETEGECAVEKAVMDALALAVGDTITVADAQGERAAYLLRDAFVITGVVNHPDHAVLPVQIPGNRDVIVLPEAFDRAALDGCYMKAELLADGTEGLDRFGEEYKTVVSEVVERLETLSVSRTEIRSDEVRSRYQDEISAGRAELDAGRAELDEARAELDEGWTAVAEGEQTLSDGAEQLAGAEDQLQDAREQLTDANVQLEDAEAELADAKAELDSGYAELASSRRRLEQAESELTDAWNALEDAKAEIRNTIRSEVEAVCGDTSGLISWASRAGVDLGSGSATAMDFWITDSFKFDLNKTLEENIADFISSQISDEVLESGYRFLMEDAGESDEVGEAEEAAESEEYEETAETAESEITEEPGEPVIPEFDPGAVRAELASAAVSVAAGFVDSYNTLSDACGQWDAGYSEYISGLSSYNAGVSRYNAGYAEYQSGRRQYQSGLSKYEDGMAEYEAKSAEYDQGLAEYEDGQRELEESRQALEDGEAQYAEGLAEYEDGQARLTDAQAQLDALDECRWVILDVDGNPSYLNVKNSVKNTADMGMTFALVFVLVGALVIYATVGRIVDEQRRLVGATKALGFFNREIFGKYLGFGVSGTVLGMVLGVACGFFGIQRILLYSYGRFYVFGAGKNAFLGGMTAVVFAAGIALSVLAVWVACSSLMRSTATSLMQEKLPEVHHREGAGNNRKGSLYTRLILLNMRSDKKRVAVTIVSVAGCCALLVAGFTMRQSVMKALNAQFDEITKYDMQIRFEPDASETAQSELEALLTDAGTDWMLARASSVTFSVNGKLLSANLITGELSELDRFYARLDTKEDEALPQSGEGVWIRQRVSEMNGVSAGDAVTVYDSSMRPYEIPVAGVFRIYAGQEMILSAEQYENYFGEAPENNAFFLYLNGADAQSLKDAAMEIEGVEAITDTAETRAMYQSFASVLNLIALMFVGIAGLMAYFILLNLVNMYINQKKRELTIMRVNGFTIREVNNYVLREMIVSTALGIVLGLGAGTLLGYRVIRLLETTSVRFMRGIQWEAWLGAALITVLYAVIINMAALRKVKYLKLTDVA